MGNDMFNGNFTNADERSWQVRYDYDFVGLGWPGLIGMVRYGHGSNATTKAGSGGKEWERDVELGYTVQSGRWRGSTCASTTPATDAASTATSTRRGWW